MTAEPFGLKPWDGDTVRGLVGRPGVVAAVQTPDGHLLYHEEGYANIETGTPIDPTTVFNVGSVAKQVTAYLTVLADRAGILSLDSPVSAVLPEFRLTDVAIVDLIHHHGGVRDAESLLSLAGLRDLDHYTADDLVRLAFRQERRATPPGRFLYSNTNYLLLAEALTRAAAMPFPSLARELAFEPFGMTTAQFKADPLDVVPHAAAAYGPGPLASNRRSRSTTSWLAATTVATAPTPHPQGTRGPGTRPATSGSAPSAAQRYRA